MNKKQGFAPVALLLIAAVVSVGAITILERNNSFSTASVKGISVIAQGSEDAGQVSESQQKAQEQQQEQQKQQQEQQQETQKKMVEAQKEQQQKILENQKHLQEDFLKVQKEASRAGAHKINVDNVDGELEVEFEDATGSGKKIAEKVEDNKTSLTFKSGNTHQEIQLQAEGDHLQMEVNGATASSHLVISVDPATGKLLAKTAGGPQPVLILPLAAQRIAISNSNLTDISTTELVDAQSSTDKLAFKVSGTRSGNILGFFPVSFPVQTSVGAQTGQVVDVNQPFWVNLLGFLIR